MSQQPRKRRDSREALGDLGLRCINAETAIREALTALRIGQPSHALQVLEAHERQREMAAGERDHSA